MEVLIIGAGVGGLTLGLMLNRAGIACRIFEAASELKAVGVGINILPHASRELCALGLEDALAKVAVTTREFCFYNRFGQYIYSEPAGRFAGYDVPQFSIHRGDLQMVLLEAFVARAGRDKVILGHKCTRVDYDGDEAVAHFEDMNGKPLPSQRGSVTISCEGIHSVLRKQLYPNEGPPKYSGINMWRGVTRWQPFMSGASMIRVGWHHPAKLLIYPIRNNIDAQGRQLVNWVCDIETPQYQARDWNRRGRLEDFLPAMADWHFDWLDVPDFIRAADAHPGISHGRSGSAAALELRPADAVRRCRASDVSARRQRRGAGDPRLPAPLADALKANADPVAALKAYEAKRLPATSEVVLANRKAPPDAILQEVYRRTGDKPFKNIDDVISREELIALSEGYKRVAGYDKERLKASG